MTTFLDLTAELGDEYLHPGGQAATRVMMAYLEIQPNHRALDVGCGTGATTALIAQTCRAQLVGVDQSPVMLGVARKRIQEARLSNVHLVRADVSRGLPLTDSVFDAAYAESSVALMEPTTILGDCLRVLRPGGKLFLNERIWEPGISQAQALEINAVSRRAFGIPAATPQPLDREGWELLLQSLGFIDIQTIATQDIQSDSPEPTRPQALRRTHQYLRHPNLIPHTLRHRVMIRRYREYWNMLENYLFFARKAE